VADSKEIYSARIRAGRRTYFFDVKEGADGKAFLKVTESRMTGDAFEQSRIVMDMEHAEDLLEAMADAVRRLVAHAHKKKAPPKPKAAEKTYTVEEKRTKHPQAYARWTDGDDAQLEQLYCEGKTNKELAQVFGRDPSAIASRIKKLELKDKYNR
jgi:DNA-directed RNA polymerase specialized sigma24 family protein